MMIIWGGVLDAAGGERSKGLLEQHSAWAIGLHLIPPAKGLPTGRVATEAASSNTLGTAASFYPTLFFFRLMTLPRIHLFFP
jgi:hypothetical protein